MEYNFDKIEKKWKQVWADKAIYKVVEDPAKPKFYVLDMFPYPSGAGLHVGHPLGYVASDIYARYKRLKGFNVLHPMGYDAFGLPAEQYAIETGTHPAVTTEKAIVRYREQLDKIGFSFDWSRQVVTCHADYYKWTQWIFLQLFNSWYNREQQKAEPIDTLIRRFETMGCDSTWIQYDNELHPPFSAADWQQLPAKNKEHILQFYRLAYRSFTEVNWCDALGCVLANDEVKDGKSERGGYPVTRKKMRQWSLRITEYADRLLDGLNRIDWSESIKEQQRNWIGRSEGCLLTFMLSTQTPQTPSIDLTPNAMMYGNPEVQVGIEVFTTRVDTLFGATFLVVAPEHPNMPLLISDSQRAEMDAYLTYVKSRTDVERQQEKKVTGCFTGSYAVHPFTGQNIPIWTAEYVLAGYGTGAIMAVPADDERDRKFAEKFSLPIVDIIDKSMHPGATIEDKVGVMINSDFLNGMEVKDAIEAMIQRVEQLGIGRRKVNYKLRDASFSRQRYWGEPFPIRYQVHGMPDSAFVNDQPNDEADTPTPLQANELPLVLPDVSSFKPTGDGRSPLANNEDWVKAGYETDTMPGYAGSSWYFLRYMDSQNTHAFADAEKINYWQDVDVYFGGAEHAVGHLLYARFWHKVLHDLGFVPTDEPFKKLVNQGMIQGRSSFVRVLYFKYENDVVFNNEGYLLPDIILSEDLYQQIISNEDTDYITTEIDNAASVIQKISDEKKLGLIVNKDRFNIMLGRVDVSYVKGDILQIEEFTNNKTGNRNIIFIKSPKYDGILCSSEVEKMSKSKYNVVNPDDVIATYGADCFRMFEMFLGPIEQSKPWDDKGISGVSNFLRKFWRMFYNEQGAVWSSEAATEQELRILHKTLKKIADDIERLSFNTCVSAFMIATNELTALRCNKRAVLEPLLIALAPFAPFISEELWSLLGNSGSVHAAAYPVIEEKYLIENEHDYPVSINGKVRAQIKLTLDIGEAEAKAQVLALDKVQQYTNGNEPKKFIFVKGKIINVVV